jgi:hypothetical protein
MRTRSSVGSVLLLLGSALVPGSCLSLSGCGPDCTRPPVLIYALRIEVDDADSGDAICDATVNLEGDGRAAALPQACAYAGGARAGQYEVTVTRDGYEATTVDVSVAQDDCSEPVPKQIKIHLKRLATP